jgi:CRISPR-associated protein Cmr6
LRQSLKLGYAAAPLAALCKRQQIMVEALSDEFRLIIVARSIAPFATGLGLEHPIENGFAFLSPYGLPYLAGSGVKGVLRRSAEELRDNDELTQQVIEALFGHEKDDNARRGALTCWDVFAVPPKDGTHKDSLVVEIMTPHFGDYYQGNSSPHDTSKPNPIPFLAVPAGSRFRFIFTCEPMLLTNAVPQGEWKTLLGKIVEHAFTWLGFGAKTAVGYGAMQEDPKAKERKAQQEHEAADKLRRDQEVNEHKAALERMSPAERAMREFLDAHPDKNQTELSALLAGLKQGKWGGELKIEIARHVQTLMRQAKKWKVKSEKKKPEKDYDYQDTLKMALQENLWVKI